MKKITFIFILTICIASVGNAQKKQEKAEEIKQLVKNQKFKFTAYSATPLTGGKVDLTSTYDFTIDSMKVEAWLPFFGRAYHADYGSTDGGIKFKEKANSIETTFNKKKKLYKLEINVDTRKDNYKIYMDVGLSGYGNLSVSSNNRQAISYYGIIEPLD